MEIGRCRAWSASDAARMNENNLSNGSSMNQDALSLSKRVSSESARW